MENFYQKLQKCKIHGAGYFFGAAEMNAVTIACGGLLVVFKKEAMIYPSFMEKYVIFEANINYIVTFKT